jgi:hypothetical protein
LNQGNIMRNLIPVQGTVTVTLAANEKIAVYSGAPVQIYQQVGYPNHPNTLSLVASTVADVQYISSAFASGATLILNAGAAQAYYEIGSAPQVQLLYDAPKQLTPGALDTTGTLTAALILGGIVTSSTAAAVTGTLDTGALVEAASDFAIGDSFDWSVINTGGNTFTVAASSGHTIVGTATVATVTSGWFRTRKTAANTFVTYRMS